MATAQYHPVLFGNRLLADMPEAVRDRLHAGLQLVSMPVGKVLYESGEPMRYVYFPLRGCIVSKLHIMKDGSTGGVAIVGNEGMIGVALFMGDGTEVNRAVVIASGTALRLDARSLTTEFNRHADLQIMLLRYTQALMTQTAQTTVCNRHHSLDQRLCRFLLDSQDRLPTNQLKFTQQLIGHMLGVRREGITEAALRLQAMKWIEYSRGVIKILNTSALAKHVCECYAVVSNEYGRLLPGPVVSRTQSPPPRTLHREWLCASA